MLIAFHGGTLNGSAMNMVGDKAFPAEFRNRVYPKIKLELYEGQQPEAEKGFVIEIYELKHQIRAGIDIWSYHLKKVEC